MSTRSKILLGILIPLVLAFLYLIWRVLVGSYLVGRYDPSDVETARAKALLDEGGRPPPTDFHSTALDAVARLGWKDLFFGKMFSVQGDTGRASSGGEAYAMNTMVTIPAPPTIQHPHLASSLGTQAPPAALLARKSEDSLVSRGRSSSDPFLDSSPLPFSPLDPRPARLRALSGGESSQMPLPRLPRPAALRGSPLKTTVRPESVGEPLPPIPAKFSSSPFPTTPNADWRVFPPSSPSDTKGKGKGKGKGKAVE